MAFTKIWPKLLNVTEVTVCVQNVCLAAMAFTSVCTEHTLPPLQLPLSVQNIIVAAISVTIVCADACVFATVVISACGQVILQRSGLFLFRQGIAIVSQ